MSEQAEVSKDAVIHGQLSQVERTEGWKYLCAAVDAELTEIDRQILDIKTPDEKANELRRVRARLLELTPAAKLEALKAKHAHRAKS